jgi:hypothetical protein
MKYRGVMTLTKRGKTEEGQQFLNYEQGFNTLSWQETWDEWLKKHATYTRS